MTIHCVTTHTLSNPHTLQCLWIANVSIGIGLIAQYNGGSQHYTAQWYYALHRIDVLYIGTRLSLLWQRLQGATALHCAAGNGHVEGVAWLLSCKASVDAQDCEASHVYLLADIIDIVQNKLIESGTSLVLAIA